MSDPSPPKAPSAHRVQREEVVHAHADGTPHVTLELHRDTFQTLPDGSVQGFAKLHHYGAGCVEQRRARALAGGGQVASAAYRDGYDAIDWSKRGGAPS